MYVKDLAARALADPLFPRFSFQLIVKGFIMDIGAPH